MRMGKKILGLGMTAAMLLSGLYVTNVSVKAAANKVLEAKTDFKANFETGDESSINISNFLKKGKVKLGKEIVVNAKMYVPAEYYENKGSFWTSINADIQVDNISFSASEKDGSNYSLDSFDTPEPVGDFYVVNVSAKLDNITDNEGKEVALPEGQADISIGAFIVGQGLDYKGAIFFDDAELVIDGTSVVKADFESGKAIGVSYTINQGKSNKATVVNFSEKALDVKVKTLNIKVGKTSKIKVFAMPSDNITFESSNKKIATVSTKGIVKGLKKGKVTITVKANGKTAKVKVVVK